MAIAAALAAIYVGPILAIVLVVLIVVWAVMVWFMEFSPRGARFRAARHEEAMKPIRAEAEKAADSARQDALQEAQAAETRSGEYAEKAADTARQDALKEVRAAEARSQADGFRIQRGIRGGL